MIKTHLARTLLVRALLARSHLVSWYQYAYIAGTETLTILFSVVGPVTREIQETKTVTKSGEDPLVRSPFPRASAAPGPRLARGQTARGSPALHPAHPPLHALSSALHLAMHILIIRCNTVHREGKFHSYARRHLPNTTVA